MTGSPLVASRPTRRLPRFLVDAISDFNSMRDPETFRRIVRDFGGSARDALDGAVDISRRTVTVRLLEELAAQPAGLAFLLQELELREGSSAGVRQLRRAYAAWEVELLGAAEWDDLFAMLDGLRIADLPRRYATFLAGSGRPSPKIECSEPWVAFLHAATFNARPGESLPCFQVLVHLLAIEASGPDQLRMLRWAEKHEAHPGSLATLPTGHFTPPAHPRVWIPDNYLIIRLKELPQPDRHGNDLLLSHWIRVDPGGQHHGRDRRISSRYAEREVQSLIRDVEDEWSAALRGVLAVEFFLPWRLLGMHVEWWEKVPFRGATARLGEDHEVVIRSLERWERRDTHGRWVQRWASFADSGGRAHAFRQEGRAQLLADPVRSVAVLSAEPGVTGQASLELSEALRAGVPVVLWDRRGGDDPAFHQALGELLANEDPRELPALVRKLRISAGEQADRAVIGRHLALLWDDPHRVPGGEPLETDHPPESTRERVG